MLLKVKIAALKQRAPVNPVWSMIAAYIRSRQQRACDQRILQQMNAHNLRDLGLSRSQDKTYRRNP